MTDTTETQDPMQDVVTILLNRMQEYPEEFVEKNRGEYREEPQEYSRFWKMAEAIRRSMRVRANIARDIKGEEPDAEFNDPLWYLSKAERQALYDGMRNACRHVFTVDVMTTLVAPEAPTKEEKLIAANAAINQMYHNITNQYTSTNAQEYYAHQQEALRRQVQIHEQMQEKQYRDALMAQNIYGKRV